MPEQRVSTKREQAQAVIDALNARDFDALEDLPFHPEMEYRSAFAVSEGGTYRGTDGLRQWARDVDGIWRGLHTQMMEFHEAGEDRAVAVIRLMGTARASGIPMDVRIGQVWTWRDGMMLRNVVYTDPSEAMRAAGLQE